MDVKCPKCENVFRRPCELSQHLKWKHNVFPSMSCEICNKKFTQTQKLEAHKRKHVSRETEIETEEIVFSSLTDFNEWKSNIEAETKSSFIRKSGTKKNNDYTVTRYYCHRSGNYCTRGKNKRSLKSKGSVKINSKCPAKMVVKCYENKVVVSYVKTHEGHSFDLDKLFLAKKERDMIAEKIAMKVPLDVILDNIRDSLTEENVSRIHLTTRRDLLNIMNCKNLNNDAVNDNISVDAWVKQMQELSNIIRLYKPQGEILEEYPQFEINDFFLVIANDAQLELLSAFGNDCLCIDGTHGLNSYDFQLYTIMIIDELQEGFPCSFLFSNREDTVAMEVYFNVVLKSLPSPISPKYFMSDMEESFYNAWSAVTAGNNDKCQQLYCSWHLDRAWRMALTKIKGKEKQVEVYKNIKVIMQESDVNTFHVMTENFMTELYADTSTQDFAIYFEKYIHNSETWAYCFRLNAGINTNMALENMHMILEHMYLQGKKVYRLDKAIYALMRFIRDKQLDRIMLHKGKVTRKLSDLRARHKSSLNLSIENIQNISGVWFVPSSRNSSNCYEIEPANTDCACDLKCDACEMCIHYFRCTCLDATVKLNMCKHIHLVARKMFQESEACSMDLNNCSVEESQSDLTHDQSETHVVEKIVKQVSRKCSSDEKLVERKRLVTEKFLAIQNMVETLDQSEALEKILDSAEHVISSMKKMEYTM